MEEQVISNNKKKKTGLIAGITGGVLLLSLILFFFLFRVQKWETVTYELGSELETKVTYYLFGTPFTLRNYQVDLSDVDNMTVGNYTVTLSNGKRDYKYEIVIEDTVSPTIVLNSDMSNINIGLDLGYETLLKEASDLSGPVDVSISVNGKECKVLHFDQIADYSIEITARDINSNVATESFTIHTVDTIAPQFVEAKDSGYFAIDDAYVINDFVGEITDNSGKFDTAINVNGKAIKGDVIFDSLGIYSIEIIAADSEGNVGRLTREINADYKPELYGVSTKTVKKNTEYDVLEGVLAWDNEGGFISDNISVVGTVDMSVEGSTTIIYSVEDEHGLLMEQSAEIIVTANTFDTNTAEYPEELRAKLLEEDYYSYDLLEESDKEAAAELMYPCQIALKARNFNGSGFIYQIDEDYIYIATVGHCIPSENVIDIWFYNPTYDSSMEHSSTKRCIEGIVIEDKIKVYDSGDDRGMLKISIDQIPTDVLIYLKEINKTNINNISTKDGVYTDTIYVAKNMYTGQFKKEFSVFNKTGEDYVYMLDYFPKYKNADIWFLTNEGGVPGQSGSLLYDGYGNPVASLSGRILYNNKSIGRNVWISLFPELYEKLSSKEEETIEE